MGLRCYNTRYFFISKGVLWHYYSQGRADI